MQDKIKNIIVVGMFTIFLLVFFFVNLFKEDIEVSISERRKLAQMPKITVKEIFNGRFFDDFEDYAVDQFAMRDSFRRTKYLFSTNIYRQKDNNKLFVKDNSIYKMEYPLDSVSVDNASKKIKDIYLEYLEGMNVYYAVIPDKNYYLDDEHLRIDYKSLEELMEKNLGNIKYIDLKDVLNKDDYYKTDIHWKQESIYKVVNRIEEKMELDITLKRDYREVTIGDFYGVYYGQVGISLTPDKIKYLTNDIIDKASTYNYETEEESKVYDISRYNKSNDKYDIFLSGATPLIEIRNREALNDRELLLFRDSFGSSIAPLLISNYKKITLIDIRYISSSLLGNYIDFNNQDVLFLYSGNVLNQNIIK